MEIDFKFLYKESAERFYMEWPEWREKVLTQALGKTKRSKDSEELKEEFAISDSGGIQILVYRYYCFLDRLGTYLY